MLDLHDDLQGLQATWLQAARADHAVMTPPPLTLYYAPGTRAMRIAFLLEELGVAYERRLVDLAAGEQRTAAYRQVHPMGLVPALADGSTVVFETGAIALYLADRFPERGLAPPPHSPQRAPYYQWVMFAVSTLEPALAEVWHLLQRPVPARDAALLDDARQRVDAAAAVLAGGLRGPWLLGERFTAADAIVGAMLVWAGSMALLGRHAALSDYAARIQARPAFARA